jgi:conjugative relaxase-like TrwC/TraI family protein
MAASISRLNAKASTHYYAKDNYYQKEDSEDKSSWFGKGSAYFKLKGPVDSEKFKNLMEGKDPKGIEYLGGVKPRKRIDPKTGKAQQHRSGIDVTFAPPKSVSLAALVDEKKEIEQAHRKAVDKTLFEIEETLSVCRVGGRGKQVNIVCKNLIVAKFEHDTSRSQDPQLHTHCVIISATRKPDGAWRRINNEVFWNNSKHINDTYLKNLKQELKEINVPLISNGNSFEIKGYSPDLLNTFSKQSKKINSINSTSLFKKTVNAEVENGRDVSKSEKYVERKIKLSVRDKKKEELTRSDLKTKWNQEYPILESAKEKTFSYISSIIGGYTGGALGEFLAGPLGAYVGKFLGGKIFQIAAEKIYENIELPSENKEDFDMRAKTKEKFNETMIMTSMSNLI